MTVAAAEHRTRQRAGMLIFFHQHFTIDDGHLDTGRSLNEALLVTGQILHHHRIAFANGRRIEET